MITGPKAQVGKVEGAPWRFQESGVTSGGPVVGIDTCSLSDVLNDEYLIRRFVDRLRPNHRLHVPGEVLDEVCCAPSGRSLDRLGGFRDLWAELPGLEVLPTFLEFWNWEYHCRPKEIPLLHPYGPRASDKIRFMASDNLPYAQLR